MRKFKELAIVAHVLKTTLKNIRMAKKYRMVSFARLRTAIVLFELIKPFVRWRSRWHCRRGLLKLTKEAEDPYTTLENVF